MNTTGRQLYSARSCLAALLLVGMNVTAAELPEWAMSPPQDTGQAIYGVGDGKDRDAAKSAALAAIAGALMTKVQGSTSVNQRQDQAGFVEQVEVQVQTKVKDTALSHYKVINATKVSRRWWVLVKLDRTALFADASVDLSKADAALTSAMAHYSDLSRMEQYLGQKEIQVLISEAYSALEFARSVSYEFQGEEFSGRYQDYRDQIVRSRRELAIRVSSDETANTFSRKLVNLLASEDIRASLGRPESDYVTIKVSSERREFDIGHSKQVKMTLFLTTTDEQGKQLASIERIGVGESLSSYESALRQASNKLARECEEQGVLNYLGFQ